LRTFSYKVVNSTTKLLPLWYAALKKHNLDECLLPRDVSTRWNLTFDLADAACKNRKAIDEITKEKELRVCEMTDEEWELAEQLRSTLKNATEYFSRADADLSHVLRTYDRIDDHFTKSIGDAKINPAIRSAIICAKATLNSYYSRTDASIMCRIATSKFSLEVFDILHLTFN
ncbi:hypothetical protein BDN72DRAFT_782648, partial [Pluteus cervinus]